MFISASVAQAPPLDPLQMSFTLLPTSSVVVRVDGPFRLRCAFGVEHLLDVVIHRVINSRSDPAAIDLASAIIHGEPGAAERLTQHLVDMYLGADWVDPCILSEPMI